MLLVPIVLTSVLDLNSLIPDPDSEPDPEFQVNPDTDPNPIRIQGFDDQKLKKTIYN
jgi:hypothetical protein